MELELPDERAIAKKYGLRELVYPDTEHVRALTTFLSECLDSGRCGVVPKTAVIAALDFLQGTVNRQNITKGPNMSATEFDVLQAPYYLAARIVAKISREKKDEALRRGRLYQTTYLTIHQFIEILRSLLDPGCYWMRVRKVPEGVREIMEVMRDFLLVYPEQRKKGRAV